MLFILIYLQTFWWLSFGVKRITDPSKTNFYKFLCDYWWNTKKDFSGKTKTNCHNPSRYQIHVGANKSERAGFGRDSKSSILNETFSMIFRQRDLWLDYIIPDHCTESCYCNTWQTPFLKFLFHANLRSIL